MPQRPWVQLPRPPAFSGLAPPGPRARFLGWGGPTAEGGGVFQGRSVPTWDAGGAKGGIPSWRLPQWVCAQPGNRLKPSPMAGCTARVPALAVGGPLAKRALRASRTQQVRAPPDCVQTSWKLGPAVAWIPCSTAFFASGFAPRGAGPSGKPLALGRLGRHAAGLVACSVAEIPWAAGRTQAAAFARFSRPGS